MRSDQRHAEGSCAHGLDTTALRFLESAVRIGHRTLETGSGRSTIVFAARAASHICVAPDGERAEQVRRYCRSKGIPLAHVRFVVDRPEEALPRLEPTPLDLVLLDGSHSFPQLFIDWSYAGRRLMEGGHLVIDDVHLWTGRVLMDFCKAEPGWTFLTLLGGRTAVFRRSPGGDMHREWTRQPYVAERSRRALAARARIVLATLRDGDLAEVGRMVQRVARGR
jgi:hypothetical protein